MTGEAVPFPQPVEAGEEEVGQEESGIRQRIVQLAILATLIAFVLLLAYGMRVRGAGPVSKGEAPPFSLALFDGGKLSLADLRGQVVVINFWASWCPPCRDEAPILEKTWRAYQDKAIRGANGVMFIGVDYMDTEREARAYIAEFDITYPNGPDLGTKIAQAYRIRGVPETFFVDKRGVVAELYIGPISEGKLVGIIERLLQEEATR